MGRRRERASKRAHSKHGGLNSCYTNLTSFKYFAAALLLLVLLLLLLAVLVATT